MVLLQGDSELRRGAVARQLGNLKTFRHRFGHRLGIALGIASAHLLFTCYHTPPGTFSNQQLSSVDVALSFGGRLGKLGGGVLLGFPLNLDDQVAQAIFTLCLLLHTRGHRFWDAPIASRCFLHFWKTDVGRIHI